jgi:NAD(P)-dependent dehydrogenase (short-subunit alcohol dehydrogenase family)
MLEGKVAIVTGAGHGIGRGHALELAAHGAAVVVNDLGGSVSGEGSGRDADLTVALIGERGGEAVANYGDVADFAAAEGMVRQAVESYGRLDILVNNAGIVRDGMLFNMEEEDFDAVVRVHLRGTFAPTRHAAAHWRARAKESGPVHGRVINTTSGAGLFGNVGQTNYGAAKAGIVGFTLTASLELARLGVTVNCIAPGGTTRIMGTIPGVGKDVVKEPDEYDEWHELDPSISSPLVAWLASDEASYVSGQVFRAIGETIVLLEGWAYGPTISNGRARWDATTLGNRIGTDIFRSRAPGLGTAQPPATPAAPADGGNGDEAATRRTAAT